MPKADTESKYKPCWKYSLYHQYVVILHTQQECQYERNIWVHRFSCTCFVLLLLWGWEGIRSVVFLSHCDLYCIINPLHFQCKNNHLLAKTFTTQIQNSTKEDVVTRETFLPVKIQIWLIDRYMLSVQSA